MGSVVNQTLFPVTLEAFCGIQEHLNGKPTSDDWQEIYSITVTIINRAYQDGKLGIPYTLCDFTDALKPLNYQDKVVVRRFALALEAWVKFAHEKGREESA